MTTAPATIETSLLRRIAIRSHTKQELVEVGAELAGMHACVAIVLSSIKLDSIPHLPMLVASVEGLEDGDVEAFQCPGVRCGKLDLLEKLWGRNAPKNACRKMTA
jgi:hypothetical protein